MEIDILKITVLFGLTLLSACLGNLKTVFIVRRMRWPLYTATFFDALVFAATMSFVVSLPFAWFVSVFATGRLFGTWLGGFIEFRWISGIEEITFYKHPDGGILLADALRNAGYSVTTTKGFGIKGTERMLVTVVAPRQRVAEIKEIAESFGPVHMVVKDVSSAQGKVGQVLPLP